MFKNCQKQISKFIGKDGFLLASMDGDQWRFRASSETSNTEISLHCNLLHQWFEKTRNLRVQHGKDQFNFNFMPHSLLVSRMAVCLYLHNLSKRALEKVNPKGPFLIARLVDDMMIISTDPAKCEEFYNKMQEKLSFNQAKTHGSASIDPKLVKNYTEEPFHIAGCQVSRDMKSIQPWAKEKLPLMDISDATGVEVQMMKKCSGLIRFYTKKCLSPVEMSNPLRFMEDWHQFNCHVFRMLASRFIAIYRRLIPRYKAAIPPTVFSNLVKYCKRQLKLCMLQNIQKSSVITPSVKSKLKKSVDQMVKKSYLEGILTVKSTKLTKYSELKRVFVRHKLVLNGMSGIGQIKTFRSNKNFDTKWRLDDWRKVSSRFCAPNISKKQLCTDTSIEL